jgi:hypothetical protein
MSSRDLTWYLFFGRSCRAALNQYLILLLYVVTRIDTMTWTMSLYGCLLDDRRINSSIYDREAH